MADEPTLGGAINDSLVRDLDAARKERDDLRALVSRPITVNVQGASDDLMRRIETHLPKMSQIPEHLAVIAGELVKAEKAAKAKETSDTAHSAALARRLDQLGEGLTRIAEVLERLAPIPTDLGDPEGDQVTDRFIHLDNENWSVEPVWAGRVCKRYGMAWTIFDPGRNDPMTAGDSCSLQHPGPRR